MTKQYDKQIRLDGLPTGYIEVKEVKVSKSRIKYERSYREHKGSDKRDTQLLNTGINTMSKHKV